jgi:hypothetical protein
MENENENSSKTPAGPAAGVFRSQAHISPAPSARESSDSRLQKNTCCSGCSKTSRCKAPEIPKSEAYMEVRRNDEA